MELLLKGIGVGVAVAAPVGPIGLLCARRALAHGRWHGSASGLALAGWGLWIAGGAL